MWILQRKIKIVDKEKMSQPSKSSDDRGQDIYTKEVWTAEKKAVVEGGQGCSRFQFSACCHYRTLISVAEE